MRVVFNKNGSYVDNEESARVGATDKDLRINAASRFGGNFKDYTVVETDEPSPWMCKLQDGEVISDSAKVEAAIEQASVEATKVAYREMLRGRIADRTASLKDICEFLIPGEPT